MASAAIRLALNKLNLRKSLLLIRIKALGGVWRWDVLKTFYDREIDEEHVAVSFTDKLCFYVIAKLKWLLRMLHICAADTVVFMKCIHRNVYINAVWKQVVPIAVVRCMDCIYAILTKDTNLIVHSSLPEKKLPANYNKKLIEKFQHHPQVKRIARHRHLPRDIFKQKRELQEMKEARRRK